MAYKRKLEVDDFESVNEPADSASVHGVISDVSPIKKGRHSEFFEGNVYDGQSTMRLIGFKKSQQKQMKQMMESKEPIFIDDCQIKCQKGQQVGDSTQERHNNNEITEKDRYDEHGISK